MRLTTEEIIGKLRGVEVELAKSQGTPQACRRIGVTEQTYHRWRKEYGGLRLNQAKRLKELERENARLKRVVADQAVGHGDPERGDRGTLGRASPSPPAAERSPHSAANTWGGETYPKFTDA